MKYQVVDFRRFDSDSSVLAIMSSMNSPPNVQKTTQRKEGQLHASKGKSPSEADTKLRWQT